MAERNDDSLLTALLSFQVLTMRAPVVGFLRHLLGAVGSFEPGRRIRGELIEALANSGYGYDPGDFASYQPRDLELTTRLAVRGANLVLLLLALSGGEAEFSALFPDAEDPADRWRRLSSFWQATLDTKAWLSLVNALETHPAASPTQVQLRETNMAFTVRDHFDLILRSNELIGDPVATGIAQAAFPFGRMDEAVLTALPEDGGWRPAAALVWLAAIGPGWRPRTPDMWFDLNRSYESLIDSCLTVAQTLTPTQRASYLILVFRQLGMIATAVPLSAVERACQLLAACGPDARRDDAAREFIRALAEIRHRGLVPAQALARTAEKVPYPSNDILPSAPLRREWVEFAAALAELGVPLEADSPLRLETVLESRGTAWRAVGGDLLTFGRLLRGARGAESDEAAVAVLRVLDMLPRRKLVRLPWRDLLVTVARAHRVDPELAQRVVGAWDTARRRPGSELVTGENAQA